MFTELKKNSIKKRIFTLKNMYIKKLLIDSNVWTFSREKEQFKRYVRFNLIYHVMSLIEAFTCHFSLIWLNVNAVLTSFFDLFFFRNFN